MTPFLNNMGKPRETKLSRHRGFNCSHWSNETGALGRTYLPYLPFLKQTYKQTKSNLLSVISFHIIPKEEKAVNTWVLELTCHRHPNIHTSFNTSFVSGWKSVSKLAEQKKMWRSLILFSSQTSCARKFLNWNEPKTENLLYKMFC